MLDHTNVLPRMYVEDMITKMWVRILRVNESLQIWIENAKTFRSLTEFRFAVSSGEIMEVPMVKCLDAKGQPELQVGNMYRLVSGNSDSDEIRVEVDGRELYYSPERFELE